MKAFVALLAAAICALPIEAADFPKVLPKEAGVSYSASLMFSSVPYLSREELREKLNSNGPQHCEEVLLLLREVATKRLRPDANITPVSAAATLTKLGDQQFFREIGLMIQKRHPLAWGSEFEYLRGEPQLLKYFEEFILNDISDRAPGAGRPVTYSERAQAFLEQVFGSSDEMPKELKEWMRQSWEDSVNGKITRKDRLDVLREWWRENREAIMNDRFAELRPPPPLTASTPPVPDAPPITATPAPPVAASSPVSPTPVVAPAESPAPSPVLLVAVAAVAVALFAGLLLFWKRRSH